jgi:hypothetical protein
LRMLGIVPADHPGREFTLSGAETLPLDPP